MSLGIKFFVGKELLKIILLIIDHLWMFQSSKFADFFDHQQSTLFLFGTLLLYMFIAKNIQCFSRMRSTFDRQGGSFSLVLYRASRNAVNFSWSVSKCWRWWWRVRLHCSSSLAYVCREINAESNAVSLRASRLRWTILEYTFDWIRPINHHHFTYNYSSLDWEISLLLRRFSARRPRLPFSHRFDRLRIFFSACFLLRLVVVRETWLVLTDNPRRSLSFWKNARHFSKYVAKELEDMPNIFVSWDWDRLKEECQWEVWHRRTFASLSNIDCNVFSNSRNIFWMFRRISHVDDNVHKDARLLCSWTSIIGERTKKTTTTNTIFVLTRRSNEQNFVREREKKSEFRSIHVKVERKN